MFFSQPQPAPWPNRPPEAAALLDGADGAAQEGTLWTGIGRLWRSACAYVRTALESQASGAAVLLGIVLLCSMAESWGTSGR